MIIRAIIAAAVLAGCGDTRVTVALSSELSQTCAVEAMAEAEAWWEQDDVLGWDAFDVRVVEGLQLDSAWAAQPGEIRVVPTENTREFAGRAFTADGQVIERAPRGYIAIQPYVQCHQLALIMAHEIGHHLELSHRHKPGHLMSEDLDEMDWTLAGWEIDRARDAF